MCQRVGYPDLVPTIQDTQRRRHDRTRQQRELVVRDPPLEPPVRGGLRRIDPCDALRCGRPTPVPHCRAREEPGQREGRQLDGRRNATAQPCDKRRRTRDAGARPVWIDQRADQRLSGARALVELHV